MANGYVVQIKTNLISGESLTRFYAANCDDEAKAMKAVLEHVKPTPRMTATVVAPLDHSKIDQLGIAPGQALPL